MGAFNVKKHKQAKQALKSMKAIGRGGPSRDFLQNVHPVSTFRKGAWKLVHDRLLSHT